MKRLFPILLLFFSCSCFSQPTQRYRNLVQKNGSIAWAVEIDTILHLFPGTSNHSSKDWYLQKLIDSAKKVHYLNADGYAVTPFDLFYSLQDTADLQAKYAGCMCDSCTKQQLFDFFRVKQIVYYSNAKLNIKNIFIRPLCLKESNGLAIGDTLLNTVFSDNNTINSRKEDLLYIGDQEFDYDFYATDHIENTSKLISRAPSLFKLIAADCKKGKLKLFDPVKDIEIPAAKIKYWRREKIPVSVYDTDGVGLGGIPQTYYVENPRESDSLYRFRIKQQLFFDKKKQVLLSVVKRVGIIERIFTVTGLDLGYDEIFCFYPGNRKNFRIK